MNISELGTQINAVVEARGNARDANCQRVASYNEWVADHQFLFANEDLAKTICQEAEGTLREMTLQAYVETGNKTPEVGVGIRVRTILGYEGKEAMDWAMEHKLALKLDTTTFEKIAKTSNLPFVTISEEPQATIATDLQGL